MVINTTETGTINISAGTITGNLTVNAPNATVNNSATVDGTITITDVASTTWNENADGNKLVVDDEDAIIYINGHTTSITVNKAKKVNVGETSSVTTFIASGAVEVTGANNITNAVINASDVVLDAKPATIVLGEDVESVTIGEESKKPEDIAKEAFYEVAKESYEIRVNEIPVANVGFDKSTNALTVTFKDNNIQNVSTAAVQFFTDILQGELGVKGVTLPAVEDNSSYPEKAYTLDQDQIKDMALHALALIGGTTNDFSGGFDFKAKIQLENHAEYEDSFKVVFVLAL